jgi:hypothetical protein
MTRFWRKVRKEASCHVWIGAMAAGDKHPNFRFSDENGRARVVKAHRVAWEDENGPLPDGASLKRLCANTHCVNPAHMRVADKPEGRPRLLTQDEQTLVRELFLKGAELHEVALKTEFAPSQLKPIQVLVESEKKTRSAPKDSKGSN